MNTAAWQSCRSFPGEQLGMLVQLPCSQNSVLSISQCLISGMLLQNYFTQCILSLNSYKIVSACNEDACEVLQCKADCAWLLGLTSSPFSQVYRLYVMHSSFTFVGFFKFFTLLIGVSFLTQAESREITNRITTRALVKTMPK